MTIVDSAAHLPRRDPTRVYFGAWVQIEADDGQSRWYRVVGPDEFDMHRDYISMDSPLGASLLGKRLDDEVWVNLPAGAGRFSVIGIAYGPHP
jgi:transcription elongation factor GreB